MHYRHAGWQVLARLTLRYPLLRRVSPTTLVLGLIWLYIIRWGERKTYASHIDACRWDSWERWPADATPHHLVIVADPQLVDPHTYPGRPWPLSTATEFYTDLYMARNFRLINSKLDADSVVFLGDLLDGGREWAPGVTRPLSPEAREWLRRMGKPQEEEEQGQLKERELSAESEEQDTKKNKRSLVSYNEAVFNHPDEVISKKDHFLDRHDNDLKAFVPGENGRWKAWGQAQYDIEFSRFDRIFFARDQLYPDSVRRFFPERDVPADPVSVRNGAKDITTQEYATSGSKIRRIYTSLPGNHDIGFGDGVQLAVRERFQSLFGVSNQVNVIANHTFVSLDTPSLSAFSQWAPSGEETPEERQPEVEHIWKEPSDFLDDLPQLSGRAVADALRNYYPEEHKMQKLAHDVTDARKSRKSFEIVPQYSAELPIILLTHVPLFRDGETDCGPLRERGRSIPIARGYQYQNVVVHGLSNTIVNKVSEAGDIVQIFSGDDHDYCDMAHRYNVPRSRNEPRLSSTFRSIREVTVKSFSWAMGVRRPGFLLVSLWNPVDGQGNTIGAPQSTVQTQLCLLPDQLSIFIDYALLFGITFIVLLIRALAVGLRTIDPYADSDNDSYSSFPTRLASLPQFRSATGSDTKGRNRASSTSTSTNHNHTGSTSGNAHLGVQRSYTARTRSVSPAPGYGLPQSEPNISAEKSGLYPPSSIRWGDPTDVDSDEESHIGYHSEYEDENDSQAKWKWKRKGPKTIGRRVADEFTFGLSFVGIPTLLYYVWLVRHG